MELKENEMTNRQYWLNVFKLSVMWSSASFCSFLMTMLNKYLEGTIYINVFYDGLAHLIGAAVASPLNSKLKLRTSFLLSIAFTLLGSVFIYLF